MLDLSKYEGHTPGPWIKSGWRVLGAEAEVVADPATFRQPLVSDVALHANARLIADAPALLAELKALRESHAQLLHLAKAAAKEIKKAYANCRCDDGECSACLDNLDELAKADEAIKQAEAL